MKTMSDVDRIYDLMKTFSLQAGEILMRYRGKVVDIGKSDANAVGGEQAAAGLALSVVDEILQEGFLWELFKAAPLSRINCEEDTPLRHLFRGNSGSDLTVSQDACDGTKAYLEGRDTFATGYGISDARNNFTHTVIAIPARDRVYIASPMENRVLNRRLEDVAEENNPNYAKVFSKRALNERGKEEARKAGLTVADMDSAHCHIVDVAMRRAGAYLYGKANPHDSFIPYAFANGRSVLLFDVTGKAIDGRNIVVNEKDGFSTFERVPSVVYVSKENPYRDKIMDILSNRRNLDENML